MGVYAKVHALMCRIGMSSKVLLIYDVGFSVARSIFMGMREPWLAGRVTMYPAFFLSRMNEMPLIIPTLREISIVRKEDIVCFAFEEKAWKIYTVDGNSAFLSNRANKETLVSLYDHLIVVNQSLIFNIDFISSIENNSYSCTLKTDVYVGEVKFSKREYANFIRKSKSVEK